MSTLSTLSKVHIALLLLALSSRFAWGQQSDVRGRLFETTTTMNSAALAIGGGASAGIGGISAASSKFNGTAVSTTTAVNSAALAIGGNASARLGGIEMKGGSDVSGT